MAVEIVHEFEAVQVHQHEGKGPAGARGPFPFHRERLHEEAVRFHSGQAVGDGLLLRPLEGERVVERAGHLVGQRLEERDFVVGEIPGRGGLDV